MNDIATLGELIEGFGGSIKTGPFGTTLKASEYSENGVPIISVGEVGYGSLNLRGDTPKAPAEVTERLPEYLLETGDIVFGRKGAVDRSAWVKATESGWFLGSDGIRVRLPSCVDSRFVAYQFQSEEVKSWLLQHASGSTMLSLNQKILERVPLRLPTIDVQRGIAEVLGALDDKIAANTALANAADNLLAATFESIIGVDSPVVRLGDIADLNRSTVKPSPGGHLRYVDIAAVGVGSYEFPSAMDWTDAPSRARRVLSKGDTLWSTVRPNRRSHALNLSDDPMLVGSTGLAVISARTVGWAYLYEVTRRPDFTSYLETVAEGSAYPAVRADRFQEALVPLAEESARDSFEKLAEPLREELFSLDKENRTLAALRDTLLPQLMSGKLRVKDAERVLEEAGV
ncbi:restriction endonuclease subunit S [Arthrobacter globiformis]|uniref:restriction endonuclease subunit S n=1 Tax=Arthrobacter globiformis TaxID=1665 RepID=UPI002780A62F|nr:restriction endonuclease subunit S [Arthrobacter globiformis]MDQ0863758.1 type I restriction enzyme S subunit [Arthrobacter globiformis]